LTLCGAALALEHSPWPAQCGILLAALAGAALSARLLLRWEVVRR
jgi:hypothetical protein